MYLDVVWFQMGDAAWSQIHTMLKIILNLVRKWQVMEIVLGAGSFALESTITPLHTGLLKEPNSTAFDRGALVDLLLYLFCAFYVL